MGLKELWIKIILSVDTESCLYCDLSEIKQIFYQLKAKEKQCEPSH
jgi:hypothetical protein